MSNHLCHPYHLVDNSPWPLAAAAAAFSLTSGLIDWFHNSSFFLLSLSVFTLLLITAQWWRDVSRESTYMGLHSSVVELGLRWGMALFIASEVFFFLSFFWAFFHSSLSTAPLLGSQWPPEGVSVFDPFGVPLLNTVILLSSGLTVTWAHHALMAGAHSQASQSLKVTATLGVIFLAVQAMEYLEASFAFSDSAYGSTFFMATGFHGLHVMVGATFLLICTLRLDSFNFTKAHHFGFEAAAWYWHFVDVVWLFLFCVVYWWGGA